MNEKLRPELNKVWGSKVTEREVITEMTRLMTVSLPHFVVQPEPLTAA